MKQHRRTTLSGLFLLLIALGSLVKIPEPAAGSVSALGEPLALDTVPVYTYKVVKRYPHDRNAFTQGLVYDNGVLYEGTGLHGESSLRRVDLRTGKVLHSRELAPEYFGEGIALVGNRIVQLTWQSNTGFVYDKATLRLLRQWSYATEGWGITYDGRRLIMSDGTATLRFLDPGTFKEVRQIEVRDNNGPVAQLNELEYIRGRIYANVWQTDRIAQISPKTGRVTAWIDLSGLLDEPDSTVDVLNGIAYDARNDRWFVTGKLWPYLFEIELVGPVKPRP